MKTSGAETRGCQTSSSTLSRVMESSRELVPAKYLSSRQIGCDFALSKPPFRAPRSPSYHTPPSPPSGLVIPFFLPNRLINPSTLQPSTLQPVNPQPFNPSTLQPSSLRRAIHPPPSPNINLRHSIKRCVVPTHPNSRTLNPRLHYLACFSLPSSACLVRTCPPHADCKRPSLNV